MNCDRFKFRVWDRGSYSTETHVLTQGGKAIIVTKVKGLPAFFCVHEQAIVEQCTGLKDRNGKLIYEGDIVSFQSRGLFFKGTVVWTQEEVFSEINLGRFHIKLLEYQGCEYEFMDYSRDRDSLEVVGNVHEDEKQ